MRAEHKGLGVRFGGCCLVCGRATGNRDWEKAGTSLYKLANGKFGAVHPACAGGSTKHKVGGGTAYSQEPAAFIEVADKAGA
jgi:hypothetical protein